MSQSPFSTDSPSQQEPSGLHRSRTPPPEPVQQPTSASRALPSHTRNKNTPAPSGETSPAPTSVFSHAVNPRPPIPQSLMLVPRRAPPPGNRSGGHMSGYSPAERRRHQAALNPRYCAAHGYHGPRVQVLAHGRKLLVEGFCCDPQCIGRLEAGEGASAGVGMWQVQECWVCGRTFCEHCWDRVRDDRPVFSKQTDEDRKKGYMSDFAVEKELRDANRWFWPDIPWCDGPVAWKM